MTIVGDTEQTNPTRLSFAVSLSLVYEQIYVVVRLVVM
jgi:hypothetical protein